MIKCENLRKKRGGKVVLWFRGVCEASNRKSFARRKTNAKEGSVVSIKINGWEKLCLDQETSQFPRKKKQEWKQAMSPLKGAPDQASAQV